MWCAIAFVRHGLRGRPPVSEPGADRSASPCMSRSRSPRPADQPRQEYAPRLPDGQRRTPRC
jgi:hypothetical protein